MGLKDMLISAVFTGTDEEETKAKKVKEDETTPLTPSTVSAVTEEVEEVPVANRISAHIGETNVKMFNTLGEILDEQKLTGPDYLKLKQATEILKGVLPGNSEDDLLKAAFATMRANDSTFTKKVVSDSIDYYVKIARETLNKEIGGLEKERKDRVDAPANEVFKLNAEIGELSAQIENKKLQVQNINDAIFKEKTLLDQREKDLTATVDGMVASLLKDKDKLNNILN